MAENPDEEPTLAALEAARDNVRRELDILAGGTPLYGRNREAQVGGLIDELTRTFHELEQCIAEWNAPDPSRS